MHKDIDYDIVRNTDRLKKYIEIDTKISNWGSSYILGQKTIKDAAKAAGLNRIIVETYFVGNKRLEEQHQFCDIISCHDARRTFVSCSLAMSIPAQVVMKCTGHKGYNTMKPYIETATETQALEMEKWNRSQYRSQIITLLDNANEELLKNILEYVKKAV